MDAFIRQVPHDNTELNNQWPAIFDRLNKLSRDIPENNGSSCKIKCLDALVDYVLADDEEFEEIKSSFIQQTLNKLPNDHSIPNGELVRIFCRLLDAQKTNKTIHLKLIRKMYYFYRLGECLCNDGAVPLIDQIFYSLQKQDFSNNNLSEKMQEDWKEFVSRSLFSQLSCDGNKLNKSETMDTMRSSYQQLYRHAVLRSHESTIWSQISCVIARTFPTIFDVFATPEDLQLHLSAAVTPPVAFDYVNLLAQSLQRQPDLFKSNSSHIYAAIEQLVVHNNIKEADSILTYAIVHHFGLITNHEEIINLFIRLCSTVTDVECRHSFCKLLIAPFIYELAKKKPSKKLAVSCFDLIIAIADLKVPEALPSIKRLVAISEFYPWKQLDKHLTHLIQVCSAYDEVSGDNKNKDLSILADVLKVVHDRTKTNASILQATHEPALEAVLKWTSGKNEADGEGCREYVYEMGKLMTELVDEKRVSADTCRQLVAVLQKRVNDLDGDSYEVNYAYEGFLSAVTTLITRCMKQLKSLPLTLHEDVARYCLSALKYPLHRENGSATVEYLTALLLWFSVGACLGNEDDARVYEKCADRLFEMVYNENEESMHSWWSTYWSIVLMNYPNVAANHSEQLLQEIIDHKQIMLLGMLIIVYPKNPQPFHERLDDLIHALFDNNGQQLTSIASLLNTIFRANPQLITPAQIDYLFTSITSHHHIPYASDSIYRLLALVANAQPQLFDKYRQQLIEAASQQQTYDVFNCLHQYVIASSVLNGEEAAGDNLTLLIDLIKNTKTLSSDLCTQIFQTCQAIGSRYKAALAKKREDLVLYESSNSMCRTLIDMIDGNKMSEEQQALLNRTVDEMTEIEARVVQTEKTVDKVTKLVKRQELHMTNLDAHVNHIDTQITDLHQQVDLHAREIERIDAKTLSYVPSEWGHQVCRLLNVRADNDWRLLGKRFGYSASELKHWAMQLDPSMSLLNEWYMTHKADEATYGLLKMLGDIGRSDVEDIIRSAMSVAGQLIPDDLPIDIKRLPPVFLSYQWGSQKAVTRLKSHLEQAGYGCWMDTGEMGGGDKLFAKIDAGIRGAKVVVCCLNKKYAQSDNCSREVHLTISTGKPLIPLQMEKQTWPPEGALGPIMSEYLYIRFFDRKANDENYWPADKFTELLGQIRYHVAPDPDMISDQYRNWFVPRVDNLIFLQPTATTDSTTTTPDEKKDKEAKEQKKKKKTGGDDDDDDTPLVVTHPQIMISYQWDYQKDIVVLYKKLTRLGYRCWLDIFQMGGGDSLFEKIDTGIRHAKCILSCVTPKYTKSINCRREMALADALQKLIVPMLIEETGSWPPAGPMSMVFAERSYVDFRREGDGRERWSGKEFEMVLARLKQAIPEVETAQPRRHILEMQRPMTSMKREERDKGKEKEKEKEKLKLKRVGSAPVIAQSRACSIM
ncbi:unnamed protein product [Adineta ricciae]|uniref:Death domain-containing protein n=1 Tax=Adineta ricciae TaxID=249248 RepID=A0A814AEC0_ADIRI|nr:unnamed protein product [Adineta ricciae]